MKALLLATSMTLLCMPSISTAQSPFDVPGTFKRVDANGDGRITPDEIRVDSGLDFDKYDLDGDGLLSRDEVREQQMLHGKKNGGRMVATAELIETATMYAFRFFDFDGDGRITREDYIRSGIRQLLLADADGDGAVTLEELARFHGQTPPR